MNFAIPIRKEMQRISPVADQMSFAIYWSPSLALSRKYRKGGGRRRGTERQPEECVPLSVREARRARRDDLWPYVWMNFISVILLFSALAIACYRVGARSCH